MNPKVYYFTFGFWVGALVASGFWIGVGKLVASPTPVVQAQLTHVDAIGHVQGATAPLVYLWYAGNPPLVHIAYSSDVLACNGFEP